MSQPCLPSASTRHIDQMKQSRFCSSATCFHVPKYQYLLPFTYHLCWHSHEDSNSDTRFRRPLHCPVVLCECVWCASGGFEPRKTRGLNPPHLPFCHKRILVPRGGLEPPKRPGSLVQRICQLCYQGMLVSPRGLEPPTLRF